MKTALLATLAALTLSLSTLGAAQETTTATLQKGASEQKTGAKQAPKSDAGSDAQAVIDAQLPSYPGNYCLVHGGRFTPERPAHNLVIDGQLYRVCSAKCSSKVEIDTVTYYQRLRKTVIGAQKADWPLTSCPVSGEAYGGEKGQPFDHVIGTRYVKLCCKGCVEQAEADPAKFLAKLDAQMLPELRKTYPLETCVISGEKLGSMGDPVEFMYGHRLVRLCCKGCVKTFHEDARKHVETIYPRKRGGKQAPAKKGEAAPQKKSEKAPR